MSSDRDQRELENYEKRKPRFAAYGFISVYSLDSA